MIALNVRLGNEGRTKILARKVGTGHAGGGGTGAGQAWRGGVKGMLSSLKNFNNPKSRRPNIAANFAKTLFSARRGALRIC